MTSNDDKHEAPAVLLEPYTYLSAIAGKGIRSQMLRAFNTWMGLDETSLDQVTAIIEKLHTASLLVDDIEENSTLRRGKPTAHQESQFGIARTLNAANYVYFIALQDVLSLQRQDAVIAFSQEMLNLHRGQGWDVEWSSGMKKMNHSTSLSSKEQEAASLTNTTSKNSTTTTTTTTTTEKITSHSTSSPSSPSSPASMRSFSEEPQWPKQSEYLQMISDKTGGLFRLSLRLMLSLVDDSSVKALEVPLLKLVELLGVFFQVMDDLVNVSSVSYWKTKGFCEDLLHGNMTFPIIHALSHLSKEDAQRLWKVGHGGEQTKSLDEVEAGLKLLISAGSLEATRVFLDEQRVAIDQCLSGMSSNEGLEKLIVFIDNQVSRDALKTLGDGSAALSLLSENEKPVRNGTR